MDGRQCVAFFTLHRGKGVAPFSDNQDAVFFRSFSVDQRYRNRGIGKVVMENWRHLSLQHFRILMRLC